MARHGRYESNADHQNKQGAPNHQFRQRSNSANKLTSGTGANGSGYLGTRQQQAQPPSNSYINRLRSQSRERMQQLGSMELNRQNSQSKITGGAVSTPVVSQ